MFAWIALSSSSNGLSSSQPPPDGDRRRTGLFGCALQAADPCTVHLEEHHLLPRHVGSRPRHRGTGIFRRPTLRPHGLPFLPFAAEVAAALGLLGRLTAQAPVGP